MLPEQGPLPLIIGTYARVSTEEQGKKGYSLPEQREVCRSKALQLAQDLERSTGRPVDLHIKEFVDDFGGDVLERPVLVDLRAFVQTYRPKYVVCLTPDRFSRSLEQQLLLTREILAAGASLEYVEFDFNPDPEGMLQYQVRGAISEFEKSQILKRTSRGKARKIREGGRPNGACPYGYKHNRETDTLEIHETEAKWVRLMFEWVAGEHIGIHLIAARLNSLGVPTRRDRGKWYRSVVSDLLRNRSYVGEMVCNRKDTRGIGAIRRLPKDKRRPLSAKERPPEQWVTVAIPTLIERGLFDRVQTALQTTTKRGGRRDTGLLSMIAKCGLCGATMGYARHTQQGRYYIRCNRRYANHFDVKMPPPKCPNPHHRAERLEQAVWDRLWAILFEPGRLERELERTSKVSPATETLTALAQELKDLDGQIAEKHREQALTIQKQLKELVTEAVADAILLDVKGALVALETRRRDVASRLADLRAAMTPDAAAGARELAALVQEKREIYETWAKTAPFDERREFVLKAVTKVIIEPSGDFDFRYA